MSVPYDQQHDESIDKPNAAPRGMHGQSVTRSTPYDERFAQDIKAKLAEEAKPSSTTDAVPPTGEPPAPVPRGVHGESVMRSKPYDERFAQEMKTKLEATDDTRTCNTATTPKSEEEPPAALKPVEEESPVEADDGGGEGKKPRVKQFVAATLGKIPGIGKK